MVQMIPLNEETIAILRKNMKPMVDTFDSAIQTMFSDFRSVRDNYLALSAQYDELKNVVMKENERLKQEVERYKEAHEALKLDIAENKTDEAEIARLIVEKDDLERRFNALEAYANDHLKAVIQRLRQEKTALEQRYAKLEEQKNENFEGWEHVRTITRNGNTSYQYRREVNPKSLRPVALRLFGKETVVRALHSADDYQKAALEYEDLVRACHVTAKAEADSPVKSKSFVWTKNAHDLATGIFLRGGTASEVVETVGCTPGQAQSFLYYKPLVHRFQINDNGPITWEEIWQKGADMYQGGKAGWMRKVRIVLALPKDAAPPDSLHNVPPVLIASFREIYKIWISTGRKPLPWDERRSSGRYYPWSESAFNVVVDGFLQGQPSEQIANRVDSSSQNRNFCRSGEVFDLIYRKAPLYPFPVHPPDSTEPLTWLEAWQIGGTIWGLGWINRLNQVVLGLPPGSVVPPRPLDVPLDKLRLLRLHYQEWKRAQSQLVNVTNRKIAMVEIDNEQWPGEINNDGVSWRELMCEMLYRFMLVHGDLSNLAKLSPRYARFVVPGHVQNFLYDPRLGHSIGAVTSNQSWRFVNEIATALNIAVEVILDTGEYIRTNSAPRQRHLHSDWQKGTHIDTLPVEDNTQSPSLPLKPL